ncbi:MAG: hypothetical protein MI864_15035 [Pseudomonadales bacterium]|nr:hypothetical protein [Pseudomonadales bacterium]
MRSHGLMPFLNRLLDPQSTGPDNTTHALSAVEAHRVSRDLHLQPFVHVTGLLLSAIYLFWLIASDGGSLPILPFWLTALLAATLTFVLVWGAEKSDLQVDRVSILFWALVFHGIGLFAAPIYEDDHFRYLWDAWVFVQHGTPYGIAPSQFFSDHDIPMQFQSILGQINYPDVPTIYGPVLQWLFLAAYGIEPGSLLAYKGILFVFNIGLIVLLLRIARPSWVILYAWSPLVVKEVAFTAHPDVIGVALLLLAVHCRKSGRMSPALFFLALSIGAKVFAWLLVPFMLLGARLKHSLIFILTLVALYLPFKLAFWLGTPPARYADTGGLATFLLNWEFNSAVFALASQFFSPISARIAMLIGFACIYLLFLWGYLRSVSPNQGWQIPRGDYLIAFFLICAPVINPWYLLWALPFAVIHRSVSLWVASVFILLAYAVALNLSDASGLQGPYDQPGWVRPMEFGGMLLVIVLLRMRCLFRFRWILPNGTSGRYAIRQLRQWWQSPMPAQYRTPVPNLDR